MSTISTRNAPSRSGKAISRDTSAEPKEAVTPEAVRSRPEGWGARANAAIGSGGQAPDLRPAPTGGSDPGQARAVASAAKADVRSITSLKEGVVYSATVGANGLGGRMTLENKGGVIHITYPIAFLGAGLFSRVDPAFAKKWGLPLPDEAFVPSKHVSSLEDIPALKQRVLEVCKGIESAFDTPFCKLHIDARMPDERAYLDKEEFDGPASKASWVEYRSALTAGAQAHPDNGEVISVIIDSLPDPRQLTPTLWDINVPPTMMAHEVAHMLHIGREGYEMDDYPINGLMTDEYGTQALAAVSPGETPKLLWEDLAQMMTEVAQFLEPAVDVAAVDTEFGAAARKFQEPRSGYKVLPHEEKVRINQERAALLLKLRAGDAVTWR